MQAWYQEPPAERDKQQLPGALLLERLSISSRTLQPRQPVPATPLHGSEMRSVSAFLVDFEVGTAGIWSPQIFIRLLHAESAMHCLLGHSASLIEGQKRPSTAAECS